MSEGRTRFIITMIIIAVFFWVVWRVGPVIWSLQFME